MKRIKAKQDLFKRLQDLDEKKVDLSEVKEIQNSFIESDAGIESNQ